MPSYRSSWPFCPTSFQTLSHAWNIVWFKAEIECLIEFFRGACPDCEDLHYLPYECRRGWLDLSHTESTKVTRIKY
jgi:hypothetical protein